MNSHDKSILRDLAKRQLEIANSPRNIELKRLWTKHNSLSGERPMVLVESGGVAHEFISDKDLLCEDEAARGLERMFRMNIYQAEVVSDDTVTNDYLQVNWHVQTSDYGIHVENHRGVDRDGHELGYRWDPPLANLESDLDRVHIRSFCVDREATHSHKAWLEDIFDGILPVILRGSFYWTMGMTQTAIYFRGLDNFMMDMYDSPEGVHRLMRLLADDHIAFSDWLEAEGLYSLNNGNDYIGSGSYGFTDLLPQPDWKPGDRVRMKDLWVLSESQETVGVSPAMFEEFIAPYQREVAERFGWTYYGCCEPVHNRWNSIKAFSNLHSISISPWCNEEIMSEALGREYVYSRKPSPALISTSVYDDDAIRTDLENTLRLTRANDCEVELIMKDVHTLNGDALRMQRWVKQAREAIGKIW